MILTYEDRQALREARDDGRALHCKECVGSGLKAPGEIGQCDACHGTGVDFCEHHCTVCEGADHHWMPQCTDDDGEPVDPHMACKHCPATRPYADTDGDE
jgi:DnaJ-class molecular chaperone